MRKRKELNACLERMKLDAILVSDPYNVRYLSGFGGGEGYLLVTRQEGVLLVDFRYTARAKDEVAESMDSAESVAKVIEVKGKYEDFLRDYLEGKGIGRMGFEGNHVRYAQYVAFRDGLPQVELVPVGDELTRLRRVKTQEELSCMKRAAWIGDQTFEEVLPFLRVGRTEREVAGQIEYLLKRNGAEGTSFDVIVASGLNSAKPHAEPTCKKIEDGEFVTLDFGCRYGGYCSDMTRTVVMGKANDRQRAVYRTVREAQERALAAIRAGMKGKDVDKVARDYIKESGYWKEFGHGLGHGVGLEIHEEPRLSPLEEEEILSGMVETVEPGVYIDGFGGVRIEDMVAVTETGCVNFTHSDKDLMEL